MNIYYEKKIDFSASQCDFIVSTFETLFSDFNFVSFITDFFREVKPLKNEMREIWHWNHKSN